MLVALSLAVRRGGFISANLTEWYGTSSTRKASAICMVEWALDMVSVA